MAISFCFAVSLRFSSRSLSVKFPIVMSWSFISWFFGSITVPVAGFMFSISLLMSISHWDSFIFPVCGLLSMRLCSLNSLRIFSTWSSCAPSLLASCFML